MKQRKFVLFMFLKHGFYCDVLTVNHGENCVTTYAFYLYTCQFMPCADMPAKLRNFLNL